jgi:hypothetical protein
VRSTARFSGFLTAIASHGFLVLGTAAQPGAPRRQATETTRAAIEVGKRENARVNPPLKARSLDKVASWASRAEDFYGALGTDRASDDRRVRFRRAKRRPALTMQFPTSADLPKLHGPVLLINSHGPFLRRSRPRRST